MIEYSSFLDHISSSKLNSNKDEFQSFFERDFNNNDVYDWQKSILEFPEITPSSIDLNQSAVKFGSESDCSKMDQEQLHKKLMDLHPWRKGPYNLFGIKINTEWRSDWKWDRLKDQITPLKNRNVLDVGCGNGYHCWRMMGQEARSVIGIDPFALSIFQFYAIKKFAPSLPVWILPCKMEEFPQDCQYFDTVFSMGVLYHRKSPFDHFIELRDSLRNNGELILETLVIDGKEGEVLVPEGRYAKMRNVWFIPSILTLELWLKKIGFKMIRFVNSTVTTIYEQRNTEWMKFESLPHFLDPQNRDLTIEGYPAPQRAIFVAER